VDEYVRAVRIPSLTFGPFVLDSVRGVLKRDNRPLALGQRALAVLRALAEADGNVVAKSDLMDRGWPGMIVEDANLTVQIAALRKLLGARDDGEEWIVTVPRVGYRLALPTAPEGGIALPARPSIAVLPFQNIGGDPEQDYFADGVVTEIITALARFRSFAVVARNSSFVYKGRAVDVRQIGAELGVRYVLEGSVRRSGDRLRINAQLVDGTTGAHLWADHFDGEMGDVFDFQDRITESVATLVEPAIELAEIERSRRERPGSVAVYDLYLRAFARITDESIEGNAVAYALLEEGLAIEPNNPILLAHAAWALEHRTTMGWPPIGPNDVERCVVLARRGLQNAAGDPRVMAHCGMALLQTGKDYDGGMAAVQAAARANPNDLLVVAAAAVATMHCGDLDEAMAHMRRALRLGPSDTDSRFALTGMAHIEIIRGNYEAALTSAARSLVLNASFDPTYWMLIAANAYLGRMDEARRFLGKLREIAPGVTVSRIRAGQPAKDPGRIEPVLEGLRLAGMAET
jgi:TolB-like protein